MRHASRRNTCSAASISASRVASAASLVLRTIALKGSLAIGAWRSPVCDPALRHTAFTNIRECNVNMAQVCAAASRPASAPFPLESLCPLPAFPCARSRSPPWLSLPSAAASSNRAAACRPFPRGGHHGRRSAGVVPGRPRIRRPSRRVEGRRGPQPGDRHRGKAPVPGRGASAPASRCSRSTRGPTRRRSPRRRPNSPGHRLRRPAPTARSRASSRSPSAPSARRKPTTRSRSPISPPRLSSPPRPSSPRRGSTCLTRVTAPIAGVTSRAAQSEGSVANANTTLLTSISQLDPIWVVFSVSENERLKLDRRARPASSRSPRTTHTTSS